LENRQQYPGTRRVHQLGHARASAGAAWLKRFSARQPLRLRPYLLDDARRGFHFLSLASAPLRGDLALLDADGDGIPDRVAFFNGFQREQEQDVFDAIEGDVGIEGEPSGTGAVARTKRELAQVIAFVHVRA
jgi:hypothetical protein